MLAASPTKVRGAVPLFSVLFLSVYFSENDSAFMTMEESQEPVVGTVGMWYRPR